MNKLFWLVELLSGRKSMKGVFVASGIARRDVRGALNRVWKSPPLGRARLRIG